MAEPSRFERKNGSQPPSNYLVQSPITLLSQHSTVQFHMVANLGNWNQKLIHKLFTPNEANVILQLPISNHGANDQLIWMHSKEGHFTIRSAYHLELSQAR